MAEESKLSRSNVRLHASQIPESFSEPLKKFLTTQPDFNDEIAEKFAESQKAVQVLQQQLSQAEKQRQQEARGVQRTIKSLQQRLQVLEGK